MRFRAILHTPFRVLTPEKLDYYFEFTKSQILFPKKLDKGAVATSSLRNGVHYKLIVNDNVDMRLRYEIVINNERPIHLFVNRYNEFKLKWVHKMYPIQKEPVAAIALLISLLSLIASTIIGILQIKYH